MGCKILKTHKVTEIDENLASLAQKRMAVKNKTTAEMKSH